MPGGCEAVVEVPLQGCHGLAGAPVKQAALGGVPYRRRQGTAPRVHRREIDGPWALHLAAGGGDVKNGEVFGEM